MAIPGRVLELCAAARAAGRRQLTELDGLEIAAALGLGVPRWLRCGAPEEAAALDLDSLPGDRVVLKAVSTTILHKSELGAVAVVEKRADAIATAQAAMANRLAGLDVEGYCLQEWVPHDVALGGQLLLGLRWTPAFGPVVALGPGGLDAEALAHGGFPPFLRSPGVAGDMNLAEELERHPFTARLLHPGRGRSPRIERGVLADRVRSFLELASAACPAPLAELELNPVALTSRGLVALDAVARLGDAEPAYPPRPLDKIDRLLSPRTAAVVGVSERMNPGRRVLRNLIEAGFDREQLWVVKDGASEVDGCRCVPSAAALPEPVDLLVLAVDAAQVPEIVEAAIDGGRAESLVVLSGGLGETPGSAGRVARVRERLATARATAGGGPVVNGGNCLGVRSVPGRTNTLFIPGHKLAFPATPPDPVALISQSGAFAIARASQQPRLNPRHLVTLGNQIDLTVADYLERLAADPEVEIFACYVEGFRPGDGERFFRVAESIARGGRSVLLYLAGRTAAGAAASASHTAAVAGDREVALALARQVGVAVAESLADFDDLLRLAWRLRARPPRGRALAALSNAGFECVALADSLGTLDLAPFAQATVAGLADLLRAHRLDGIVAARNPLDLTPILTDEPFAAAAALCLADPGVDAAVVGCVPLTGALATVSAGPGHEEDLRAPGGVAERLAALWRTTTKPWVAVVDSGALYDPLAAALDAAGIPVFRSADRALRLLAAWIEWRLAPARRERPADG